jgi:hypothetical protein
MIAMIQVKLLTEWLFRRNQPDRPRVRSEPLRHHQAWRIEQRYGPIREHACNAGTTAQVTRVETGR